MATDIKPVLTDEQILAVGAFGQSPLKRLEHGRAIEREVLRVLADREGRQQWQPIETAPEGVMILCANMLAREARDWAYVAWIVGGKVCGHRMDMPTHWMPLPAPPAQAQRAKEDDHAS